MPSAYLTLLQAVHFSPERAVFEIGAHDGTDSLAIKEAYNVPVYGFEPNPEAIELWRRNAAGQEGVHLIEKAVSEVDGEVQFFPFDRTKYDNIGASSLFVIDFAGRGWRDGDRKQGQVQREIRVPSIRLDTFIQQTQLRPDVLCLDCQEGELGVLRSMGEELQSVNAVVAECTFTPTYKGGCSYPEVERHLANFGMKFRFSSKTGERRPRKPLINDRYRFFDAVFVRQ